MSFEDLDGFYECPKCFEYDRERLRLKAALDDSERRNATSLEVIAAREQHIEQQRLEIEKLKHWIEDCQYNILHRAIWSKSGPD